MPGPGIRVAAVVLAAGCSRRMGAPNKLHLPIDGEPLIRHCLQVLLGSGIDRTVVVLGHDAEQTRALIEDLPLETVVNEAHAEGQMTSVSCGLDALGADHDMFVIALADQPALNSGDIDRLIRCFAARDGAEVMLPTHLGQRGNPVIISAAFRRMVLDDKQGLGCRRLINNHPALVRRIEMSSPAFVIDLDTPEQYARFIESAPRKNGDNLSRQVG